VYLEDERVQPAGIEVLRLEQPSLDPPPVRRGEQVALGLCDIALSKPRIQVGQSGLSAIRDHVKLPWVARVGCAEGKDPGGDVEIKDSSRTAGLRPYVAVAVAGVKGSDPGSAGEEVKAIAIFGPADADAAMTAAHVRDDAVADRLVERESQAPWNAAA